MFLHMNSKFSANFQHYKDGF